MDLTFWMALQPSGKASRGGCPLSLPEPSSDDEASALSESPAVECCCVSFWDNKACWMLVSHAESEAPTSSRDVSDGSGPDDSTSSSTGAALGEPSLS